MGLRSWFFQGAMPIRGLAGDDQFGLRWNSVLFPFVGTPAVHPIVGPHAAHLQPASAGTETSTVSGHAEPTLTLPIDADSAPAESVGGLALDATPQTEAVTPAEALAPEPVRPPPFFADEPLHDSSSSPAPTPSDSAPPGGFIPRSEALIWSGPAIMAFPGESHDAVSDSTTTADVPDSTGGTGPESAPDTADTPDAVTRSDLDPILAAMGSGQDHAAPTQAGGGDLSAAFLPPDGTDLGHPGHGLDPGFAFTPQPLPPPPDIIG